MMPVDMRAWRARVDSVMMSVPTEVLRDAVEDMKRFGLDRGAVRASAEAELERRKQDAG